MDRLLIWIGLWWATGILGALACVAWSVRGRAFTWGDLLFCSGLAVAGPFWMLLAVCLVIESLLLSSKIQSVLERPVWPRKGQRQ